MPNSDLCPPEDDVIAENWAIGMCLRSVGVLPGDSRDAHNELRFIPFEPHTLLIGNYIDDILWYFTYGILYGKLHLNNFSSDSVFLKLFKTLNILFFQCQNCLSKHAISFHYMPPKSMYLS